MIFEKRISWRCHLHSKEEKTSFSWNSTEKPLTKTFHFGYMFDTADGSSCRWLWLTRAATPYWNCIPWSTQHSASPLHPCLVLETHQEPRFAAGWPVLVAVLLRHRWLCCTMAPNWSAEEQQGLQRASSGLCLCAHLFPCTCLERPTSCLFNTTAAPVPEAVVIKASRAPRKICHLNAVCFIRLG